MSRDLTHTHSKKPVGTATLHMSCADTHSGIMSAHRFAHHRMQAFIFRKLKIKGSMAKAMKVPAVLEAARAPASKL